MIANNRRATTNSDPAAQSGLDSRCPERRELEELRVDFHARRRSVQRRRAHVAEARRQGADENDPAVDLASIDLIVQQPGGRNHPRRVRMRITRPNVGIGSCRDFHGADGDRVHARMLPERGFAARIGGLDDIRRLPLGEPQRLERERRRGAGGSGDEKRHAAHDLVMIGQPVRGAQSLRRFRQNAYGRDNSRERHQKRRGVVARHGQSRLWLRTPNAARRDKRHAQRDGRGGDGLGEDLVAGGRVRQDPRELVARRSVRERSHDVLETHPVGLGENEIEYDRRGAEFGQLVRQFGETRSRPRPLSEDSQTFFVDADHANRRVPVVSPRRRPLEGIENEIAQIVEKQRLSQPPGKNQKRGQQRGKQINDLSSPHPLLRSRRKRPALIRGDDAPALPDAAIARGLQSDPGGRPRQLVKPRLFSVLPTRAPGDARQKSSRTKTRCASCPASARFVK